jgi:signal transduction histidine kinase
MILLPNFCPGFLMKKTLSIRTVLLTSVTLLTLVPMLTAVAVSVVMFHLDTSDRIRMENMRVAQTVNMAVDLFLARPVVMLKQIRDEVNEDGDSAFRNLTAIANDTLDTDPLFESVQFVDAAGVQVGSAGPAEAGELPHKRQNFSENELFRRVKKSGALEWSAPFVSLKTGESVISVALPWRGGMIAGTMNLSYLCKLVEPTRTAMNAYAFIVSPAGRLIAHPDRALVGEKEAFISLPQITAGFQGTSGTYAFTLAGRKVIGSVLPFGQNGWVIVSVNDKAQSYATLYQLEELLALLAVVVFGCSLYFAYRRVEKITAPVQALTESSKKIAAGEKVIESVTFSAYSEVHDLYENFQKMAVAVSQRERDLQERNEELAVTEEELRHQVDEYLRTYDELVAEKVKLESILACMGEGLSIQNLQLEVVLQNDVHKKMYGDVVGKLCYTSYEHQGEACVDCPVQEAFADGQIHVVLRKVKRNGESHYLEVTASPLRSPTGEMTGGIEIVRDVTERVAAENEVRRLNQELEERVVERTAELEIANSELEAFSYSVSHDLRAPLRHISSFSSILESDYAARLDKDGSYYLSRIIAGCDKMGLLIDDLLELAQVTRRELRMARVNLSRIVSSVAASLVEREPERRVTFRIEDGLVTFGDERLLEVMLTNLIGNAWKYCSQKPETVIEFGCKNIAARPVYFIKDNGAGFDTNYADKLFTPFQRLHGAEFEGTGIGLAIVQRIVHRHGGKIWADAVVGEGAIFYFTLNLKNVQHP